MLVYGDPQFEETLHLATERLRLLADACSAGSIDELRTLLIQAGQLEQAMDDRCECDPCLRKTAREITNFAAEAFYSRWRGHAFTSSPELLRPLRWGLGGLASAKDALLNFKIPEGFEFYALFPEQYCAAAEIWARQHAAERGRVLVVGIRSIGTTLSAIVQATLGSAGWNARRLTVRPSGDPFNRQVSLDNVPFRSRHAIVVDEGPGMSGSSIAAVVGALHQTGFIDICIFPGHNGEPGNAAPEHSRRVWAQTPRIVVPLQYIRWDGSTLCEQLVRMASELDGEPPGNASIVDFSGGLWRHHVYASQDNWPPVAAVFERMKYWCPFGNNGGVLWKFAGLGSAYGPAHTRLEARRPWKAPKRLGFESFTWAKGTPLPAEQAGNPDLLKQAMDYIASSAGPELFPEEQVAAVDRLRDMLYWNTRKAAGEAVAQAVLRRVSSAEVKGAGPTYTDGHVAPHEWIYSSNQPLLVKVDTHGHLFDHTLVGPQSVLWDVAGLCVEWDISAALHSNVIRRLKGLHCALNLNELRFYEAAYTAFRLGFCDLTANQTGDSVEKSRLQQARARYLQHLLSMSAPEGRV